jgi:broad specificity phosphatase PhoE
MLPRLLVVAATFAASVACAQQSVILVRHAELADANGMDAKAVPLSAAGQARASQLAKMVEKSGVAAVYATDFMRTQATAEPSAGLLKHQVIVASQNDAQEFVARLRKEHADQVVLVVGHSDTVPSLIKAFGVPEEVKIDKADFGNVFVVTPKSGSTASLLKLRY